jgi:hypothetical protein
MAFRSTASQLLWRGLRSFSAPAAPCARLLGSRNMVKGLERGVGTAKNGASANAALRSSASDSLGSLPLQVTVGVLCASYWRGAWYIFDYTLFPDDRVKSSLTCLSLGSILLGMEQFILSRSYNGTKWLVRALPPPSNVSLRTYFKKMNRFLSLYGIAISCILVWRGTWVMWDVAADEVSEHLQRRFSNDKPIIVSEEKDKQPSQERHTHEHEDSVSHHEIDKTLFYSGIASHVTATIGLLLIGRFKSVMAPPANVSMMKDMFIHGQGKKFARAARSFAKDSR